MALKFQMVKNNEGSVQKVICLEKTDEILAVDATASTENFIPPNPTSKDVRDSVEATTSFFTHLGSFGV